MWKVGFNVTALDLPHNEYPFHLIAGITKYQGDFNSDGDVDNSNLALLIDSGDYLWIYLQKITA